MHRSFLEENYLEAIYILQQRNESVRSIDVAEYLSVAKSSVNSAVNKLLTQQYITFEDDKII
ncbi:TPA: metal-dependent transcriptional regulator, partial [Streptococcus agalactiae]|nr:metal-dependent transcriptional regulator [Streptococcus agalactiae]